MTICTEFCTFTKSGASNSHPENSFPERLDMNSLAMSSARSAKPALELITLATLAPDLAHRNLRALLLSNPDYFGKITSSSFKAVLRIQQNTAYESIGYVTYCQKLEQLQATINISDCSGYSEGDCASKEFVRFYLSHDGGSTWLDQGMSSINVCNMAGPKPQQETVEVSLCPALTLCFLERLPLVRTILSWNAPPPADMPDWLPVWGDVLNAQIQIEETDSLHPGFDCWLKPETNCSAF
jgi:hypothetical protein